MPTLEEFDAYVKQLGNHDWTFEYSDDGRVWRRGKDQQKVLLEKTKDEMLSFAYLAYVNYTFADEKMSWPDRLIKRSQRITELRQQICIAMTNKLLLNAA